jgi:hypothetical protein
VRDGLVSAVVLLVAKRYADVAQLFGDLMLLPPKVLRRDVSSFFCNDPSFFF